MTDPALLISNYFNGALDADGEAALREYLRRDPAHIQEFMQAALLHSLIGDYYLAAAQSKVTDALFPFVPAAPVRPKHRYRLLLASVAALLLVSCSLIFGSWFRYQNTPIAILTRAVNVEWNSPRLTIGQSVNRRPLDLRSGFAEFTYPDGAVVLVQGPASFRLQSLTSMQIYQGRATTSIPQPAIGFTVNTPTAAVIDLGTEVGIDVSDVHSHIEVFKGKAGIRLNQTSASAAFDRVLTATHAVDISSEEGPIDGSSPQPFVFTRVDDLDQPPAAFAETFNHRLLADPDLLAFYAFDGRDEGLHRLINRSVPTAGKFDGDCVDTTWTDGPTPNSRAIAFDGVNSRVLLHISTPAPALTITAWVNTVHLDHPYSGLLMSDGATRTDSCHFQLCNVPGQSSVLFSTPAAGSPLHWYNHHFPVYDLATNLNTWRFVAVVYDPASAKCSGWLDGELRNICPIIKPTPITIGSAELGNWSGAETQTARAFHGALTRVAIFKRPLAGEEIEAIYNAQKLTVIP
jgi:hypothetical protein